MTTYISIADIISVEEDPNSRAPLNLTFKHNRTSAKLNTLRGPGIYLISFDSQVIYVGKYQPLCGDILADRWLRHIETITLRGHRVGFGKPYSQKKLMLLCESADNDDLKGHLTDIYDSDQGRSRFKDTGVVTSRNRIRFAGENWNNFGQATAVNILSRFEFRLVQFGDLTEAEEAKKFVSCIEKGVLLTFKPICNKEYVHERDNGNRDQNRTIEIVEKINALCVAISKAQISECIVVGPSPDEK
jgi:hypothetical protein